VRPHSVFLRKDCILPDHLEPLQEPVCENWTMVQEIAAPVFDSVIRQSGWHFMWINGASIRRGFGTTQQNATSRALTHALQGVRRRFNAAELDSVQVTRYPGFFVANVSVQPRQIQHDSSLDAPNEGPRRS
jgi:hypothetical protein